MNLECLKYPSHLKKVDIVRAWTNSLEWTLQDLVAYVAIIFYSPTSLKKLAKVRVKKYSVIDISERQTQDRF